MTPPVLDKPSEGTVTKQFTDKNLVMILIAFEKPYTYFKEAGKTVFEFAEADVADILYLWKTNRPIPIDDCRKLIQAAVCFNSAVRD